MTTLCAMWTTEAWNDYVYWQGQDRKTLKRINQLVEEIQRSPFEGIGKPESLRANLANLWSRRIDDTHRLVYEIEGMQLRIVSCRYHY